ncbi:SusC/RagA family TonB-linked outer membrane protein [Pedobacter nyackensis]|uniref:TonB-linked outer membrane protein, SusC/RagA family n=1 Tax=Pedobacter nyackensis TaxID=475255 RepID=A0A1W2CKZ1_9SPHI|nr:SusC/RagA family TonB-linked outer membrane protein [Pedobacter nyackensis]SMC85851.1 TonB-linked outer membrane protein, SusC/RagA family [Pedobacter nyackensis]
MKKNYSGLNVFRILLFLLFMLARPSDLWAQQITVSGTVRSASFNLAIPNVKVLSTGNNAVVSTNEQGKFAISTVKGEKLTFSLSGFITRRIIVNEQREINLVLFDNPLGADTTYSVLFGKPQKRKLSVSGVSEIYTSELEQTNSRTTAGLLVGRMTGLYGNQASGEPGGDNVTLSLRGNSPLVMVDGTPQSFGAINPEQIESVTLMKDALSTVMMGSRSANGILYIITKKGREEAQRISFKLQSGIQQPLKLPELLDSYNYGLLYNEARANAGLQPIYTQEALTAYKSNSNPLSYPNVNWYDEILKKHSSFSRYDLAVAGGGKISRYFVNLDYLDQGGLLKTSPTNSYNTNADFRRYGFRTNVSVDITKILTAAVNLGAQIQNGNEPGSTVPTIFANILKTPNNAYPVHNADGSYGGDNNYTSNILGQTISSGYRPYTQSEYKADLSLKADLKSLTTGLWARATAAYKSYLLENITRSKTFEVFKMSINAADTSYTRSGPVATAMVNQGGVNSRYRMLYTELALGYDRDFGTHGLNLFFNASNDNVQNGDNLQENFRGIAGRASYNFDEKYLAEFAFGYNGVERYPKNQRYGFFPAFGLGWNLSEEGFLKGSDWLSQLKLRATYGLTGNANAGYYVYNQYYVLGSSYNIANTPTNAQGIAQGASNVPANTLITWEKAKKLNAGIDIGFFEQRLSVKADYFVHNFYDLLQAPGTRSAVFGGNYPSLNIGKVKRTGAEFQLLYQDKAGSLSYFIQPNLTILKSTNVFSDELQPNYPWQMRTGLPVGQPFGYVAEGLFQSNSEAAGSPAVVGYTPQAGDIRYKDLNGDGIIDANDVTAIGHQKPLVYYGLTFGFNVKGFDLNALIQGVENRQVWYTGASVWEFENNGTAQAFAHHLNRWTPENAVNATYPRLTIGTNINNQANSSYWLRSGDYFRLKSIELGYTIPASLTKKISLATARVFFNGTNLFTGSDMNALDLDPEVYSGGYPTPRIFSGGINVKF